MLFCIALCWCRYTKVSAIELLLANGCDPNVANCNGNTPLHVISMNGFFGKVAFACYFVPILQHWTERTEMR